MPAVFAMKRLLGHPLTDRAQNDVSGFGEGLSSTRLSPKRSELSTD